MEKYASLCAFIPLQTQSPAYAAQVHLFAHLTAARIVSAQTMFELLKSFTAVLEEFAVSHGRAKKAALCAAEGLMIVGICCISIQTRVGLTSGTGRTHHKGRHDGQRHGNHYLTASIYRDDVREVTSPDYRQAIFNNGRYRDS